MKEAIDRLEAGLPLLDVEDAVPMALRILEIGKMDAGMPIRLKVYGALNTLQTFLLLAEEQGSDRASLLSDLIRALEEDRKKEG